MIIFELFAPLGGQPFSLRRAWPRLASAAALAAWAVFLASTPVKAQVVCQGATGNGGSVATGANADACGVTATASGDSSSAVGLNSIAAGLESTADGFFSQANGRGATALGGRSQANGIFATGVGWANVAAGNGSFAAGNRSLAGGLSSVAIGDVAQATGDQAIAIGKGAIASGTNSVALGAGSVAADANTVSVGSATAQRRITNLAAGTSATDAATFGQLQSGLGGLEAQLGQRADSGTAAAMAVAGLPQAFSPGKGMISFSVSSWRNEQAFAAGASKVIGDKVFKAGAAIDSHGNGGGVAGVGFQF